MKRYATVANIASKFKAKSSTAKLHVSLDDEEEEDNLPAVQCSCRLRPLNEKEMQSDTHVPWSYTKTQIRITKKTNRKTYTFDHVLAPESKNEEEHDFLGESTYSDNNNSNEVVHNDEVDNEDDVKSIASSKSSIVVNVAL